MSDESAVPPETNRKALSRIRKREEPGNKGPWKWQLINAILECQSLLRELIGEVKQLQQRNEAREKLAAAGRKSAEARRAKFGSAAPPNSAGKLKNAAEPESEKRGMGDPTIGDPSLVPEWITKPPHKRNPEPVRGHGIELLFAGPVTFGSNGSGGTLGAEGVREPVRANPPEDVPLEILPGMEIAEPVREPVRKKAKKKTSDGPGPLVWAEYELAYQQRWNVTPLRAAKVNRHVLEIVAQVGPERAKELVRYYVGRNDSLYLNAKHPISLLLVHLQKLHTEFLNGASMTQRESVRAEAHAKTEETIRNYVARQGLE